MPEMNRDEIFEKVQQTLIDALSVEEDEVTETATLTGDLGAESIDFLDIVFRLEKTFDIKIPQEELIPRDILSNADYVENRKLNAAGLAALKESMPHADLSEFEQDPDIDKISDVFKVGTIINFVEAKLAAKG
ncbi:MAG: acyl carrier protein [Planctomycetota bacterium]